MLTCQRTLHCSVNTHQPFHDKENMKPEYEIAWGSPIKDANKDKTLVLWGGVIPPQDYVEEKVSAALIESVVSKFKTIAAVIEADIAYFNTFKGQSMAANRLSFLKRDILDNVARLEKACQIK